MPTHFFLHVPSCRSWPTDDPHQWLIDRHDDDLLASARERLTASPEDADRCLRVVFRRCGLVLVRVVTESQIIVRYWSGPAPDLRAWAKEAGWNRPGVQVVVAQEKTGKAVVYEDGQDVLLYGHQVGPKFPWDKYAQKFERRQREEADDQNAAPATSTNFDWPGSPPERLTWQVLKAIWNAERIECPNCDQPLLVTSYEWTRGMLSFRSARVIRHCLRCHCWFEAAVEEPLAWLASVLSPALRPSHLRLWKLIPVNWISMSLGQDRPVQLGCREG